MGTDPTWPSPESLVRAAERIADRLGGGGRLVVEGRGRAEADARHVVVEFMHPVTVGRRSFPAVLRSVDAGMVDPGSDDVTMSISYDASAAAAPLGVDVAIAVASAEHEGADPEPADRPMVHVALPTEGAGATEPGASKVAAVLSYHVIWELVHVLVEATGSREPAARPASSSPSGPPAASLYPMLYGHGRASSGARVPDRLRSAATASAAAKIAESDDVRTRALRANEGAIERIAALIGRGGSIFTFGNGGSSTDASDAAFLLGARAHALGDDVATITALANDVSFDVVFARQLATLGRPGDCAIAFSTSGNSPNLIEAARAAKRRGMTAVGFAGYDGGAMATCDAFDVVAVVSSESVHRIQEAQSALFARVTAPRARRVGF